jgi:hypothetical protein
MSSKKPTLDNLKRQLDYLQRGRFRALEVDMATDPRELVTSYIQAVGERRLEALPPLLEPDAQFTLGDNTVRGRDNFVGAFRRLLPIIDRNEIRHLFIDGDEACVVYDFVTSTPVGPVLSVEHIKLRNGRIASSTLVFERLHWPEVVAELKEREVNAQPVPAA